LWCNPEQFGIVHKFVDIWWRPLWHSCHDRIYMGPFSEKHGWQFICNFQWSTDQVSRHGMCTLMIHLFLPLSSKIIPNLSADLSLSIYCRDFYSFPFYLYWKNECFSLTLSLFLSGKENHHLQLLVSSNLNWTICKIEIILNMFSIGHVQFMTSWDNMCLRSK